MKDVTGLPDLLIGDLRINPPIIQGGMGVRISGSRLASAVSNEGALGVVASVGTGEEWPDRSLNYAARSYVSLRDMLQHTKALTPNPIAVNIMCALTNYDDLVKAADEENVAAIISGAGLPLRPDRKVARPPLVPWAALCVVLLAWIAGSGCSLLRWYAIDQLANAVAHSGTTWSSEEDPDLLKAAAPFSLKLMESVLAETPQHQGLLSATASGFTQYAFAFVQQDADELEARDLAAAEALRRRAKRLYLRARNYGLRGLAVNHPGFPNALLADPRAAVRATTTADVPFLYWTAAGWAAAISLSVDTPELIAQIPAMEALMDRALELNDSYHRGAIHTFLITYEMSRQGAAGDPAARARAHFERAMALAEGTSAAPLVALAEAVAVRQQDLKGFESLLNRALALNPDAHPDTRLLNLVMQRRARWLLSRKAELFLIEDE